MPALPTVAADTLELPALQLALRAAELGSVAAAARERDWLPATATAAIRRLEAQLGAALFTRNSRALRPTPEGAAFLQRAREALTLLGDGVAALREPLAQVRGLLRLGMPADLGTRLLRPLLDEFMALHPALQLELQVGDRLSDLAREPVDAALRYGEPQQPGLIVRRLADNHRVLVASPDYLARAGTPQTAEDIAQHQGISLRLASRPGHVWTLLDESRPVTLRPQVRRIADNGLVTREWALAGHGIAMKSRLDVADDLAAGRLVQVLPALRSAPYPLVLALASGSHLSARVRALGDFLSERLNA